MTKDEMVRELARQVTQIDDEPYDELDTALRQLIAFISEEAAPSQPVDWAAIVCEATNLRPNRF